MTALMDRAITFLAMCTLGFVVSGPLVCQTRTVPVRSASIDLRIGDQDGEFYELDRISSSVLPLPNGGVLIPQEKEGSLREFDAGGKYVRTIGRRGSGPGEFQTISALGSFGDTVWVADNLARRITTFSPVGKPVGTAVENFPASTSLAGIMRGGALLFRGQIGGAAFRSGVRSAPTVLVDPKTKTPLLTRSLLTGSTTVMAQSTNGVSSTRNEIITRSFAQDGLSAMSNDGQTLAVIDRRVIADGNGGLSVDVYDARGQKKASVRIARTPTKSNVAFFDNRLNKWAENMAKFRRDMFKTAAAAREYIDKELKLPATYPLAGGLVVESENAIWIAEPYGATELFTLATLAKDPGIIWERYDLKGVLQQRVRIPSAVDLKAVHNGMFWGVASAEDEVQMVVRLKVTQ